jgi:hypothetical protein
VLQTLSSLEGHRKGEPFAISSSSGTAFDGGWRRWWAVESRRCGSDWISLVNAAEAARSAFVIGDEPMTEDWKALAQEAWNAPSWRKAAAAYHKDRAGRALIVETPPEHLARLRRLMSNSVSLDAAWDELNRLARERYNEAPKTTYDAVEFELRTNGLPQLGKPNCQRRLADLSIPQFKNLMASLQQRRGQYPHVSDELLTALATIYDARIVSDEQ